MFKCPTPPTLKRKEEESFYMLMILVFCHLFRNMVFSLNRMRRIHVSPVLHIFRFHSELFLKYRFLPNPANPIKPEPNKNMVPGSGITSPLPPPLS